jgi:hypothetical protein
MPTVADIIRQFYRVEIVIEKSFIKFANWGKNFDPICTKSERLFDEFESFCVIPEQDTWKSFLASLILIVNF